jgi:hypothetical protein
MKRFALTSLALLLCLPAWAQSPQYPQTLPMNSVWGRLGISPGPPQAIPFVTLAAQLRQFTNLVAGPSSTAAGHFAFWNAANGTLLSDGGAPGALAFLGIGTGLGSSGGNLNLQPASASTIGGVNSIAAVAHQWISSISTAGLPALSQPAIADISGWGTGVATALGNAVTGTGNMVLSASPTFTGTISAAGANFTSSVIINNIGSSAVIPFYNGAASQGVEVGSVCISSTYPCSPPTNGLSVQGATTLSSALTYGGVTLANAVTGTGSMVLSTSPTLVTPALGTPSSLTLTNATGLPFGALPSGISDTALGYWGSTVASALAIGNCSNALTYSTSTHTFGCNSTAGTGTVTSVATAGLATGGPISSTGTVTVTAAAKTDQQTGTSNVLAVTPLHQQDHDSAVKAWVSWTGSTGALQASYNVSSVTRTAAGNYTVNFTTAFATTNYSCIAGAGGTGQVFTTVETGTQNVGSIVVFTAIGGTGTDPATSVNVHCFGRQ